MLANRVLADFTSGRKSMHYSIDVGKNRWLACIIFMSRPTWIPCRPIIGVSSFIIVAIAAGDALRGLLLSLFAGGGCSIATRGMI